MKVESRWQRDSAKIQGACERFLFMFSCRLKLLAKTFPKCSRFQNLTAWSCRITYLTLFSIFEACDFSYLLVLLFGFLICFCPTLLRQLYLALHLIILITSIDQISLKTSLTTSSVSHSQRRIENLVPCVVQF